MSDLAARLAQTGRDVQLLEARMAVTSCLLLVAAHEGVDVRLILEGRSHRRRDQRRLAVYLAKLYYDVDYGALAVVMGQTRGAMEKAIQRARKSYGEGQLAALVEQIESAMDALDAIGRAA